MTIHIEGLSFDAIIGLLDFEREHVQPVRVDLEAEYHYTANDFIDYAELTDMIMKTIKKGRYKLLEDALLSLEALIHSTYPQITSLFLKITKPDIIKQCHVSLSHSWRYKTRISK
jgi:dihydroneopterin aldolase